MALTGCKADEAKRVEIAVTGNAGKYNTQFCAEVTWNGASPYTLDACSPMSVAGQFTTNLVSEGLNKEKDFFDHVGKVYMSFGTMPIFGTVLEISEPKIKDDVATIQMTVSFGTAGTGGSGQGGGFSG